MRKTKTLKSLYRHLDALYKGVWRFCQKCKDPCCYGYIWLLEKEAGNLYKKGVPIIEINKSVNFIHSFPSKNGKILVNQIKPPCILSKKEKCSIYKNRPLVCRLYPIDIKKQAGIFYFVIHKECPSIKKPEFFDKTVSLMYDVEQKLLKRILNTFERANELSDYPLGKESKSDYIKLLKVWRDKGGELKMSKCKAVLDSKKVKSIKVKSKKK